jgi:hypothetical protein
MSLPELPERPARDHLHDREAYVTKMVTSLPGGAPHRLK